jgi:hypothetical protein
MPIVETPEQAIQFFLNCELDVLVLDNYLVKKAAPRDNHKGDNTTDNIIDNIRAALDRNPAGTHQIGGVCQINIAGTRTLAIDLSKEKPLVTEGKLQAPPIATIEVNESDFLAFWRDPVSEGPRLFQAGKIKIDGDQDYAIRLVQSLRLA